MPVTQHPPYRSVLAELPHTAPTSSTWRQSVRREMDVQDVGAATKISVADRSILKSTGTWPSDSADELP